MTHFNLVGKCNFSLTRERKKKKRETSKIEHMDKQRLMKQELGLKSERFKYRTGNSTIVGHHSGKVLKTQLHADGFSFLGSVVTNAFLSLWSTVKAFQFPLFLLYMLLQARKNSRENSSCCGYSKSTGCGFKYCRSLQLPQLLNSQLKHIKCMASSVYALVFHRRKI